MLHEMRMWLELQLCRAHQISGVDGLMIDKVLTIFAHMPEIVYHAVLAVRVGGCSLLGFGGRTVRIIDLHSGRLCFLGLSLVASLDLNVPSLFFILETLLELFHLIFLLLNLD